MNSREDNRFHVGSSQAVSLLSALRSVGHLLDCHSRQLMRSCGLSLPQLLVLHAAHRHSPARSRTSTTDVLPCVQDLVDVLSLNQATVTDIVRRLERRGYLQRRQDHLDKRRQLITLTASGTTAIAEAPSLIPPEFLAHFSGQSEARLCLLIDILNGIATCGGTTHSKTGGS